MSTGTVGFSQRRAAARAKKGAYTDDPLRDIIAAEEQAQLKREHHRDHSKREPTDDPTSAVEEEDEEEEEEEDDHGVTRCVCDKKESWGLMICCEECQSWQHCECVGLTDKRRIPSVYYCEQCRPDDHPYFKMLAQREQQKKRESKENGDSSGMSNSLSKEKTPPPSQPEGINGPRGRKRQLSSQHQLQTSGSIASTPKEKSKRTTLASREAAQWSPEQIEILFGENRVNGKKRKRSSRTADTGTLIKCIDLIGPKAENSEITRNGTPHEDGEDPLVKGEAAEGDEGALEEEEEEEDKMEIDEPENNHQPQKQEEDTTHDETEDRPTRGRGRGRGGKRPSPPVRKKAIHWRRRLKMEQELARKQAAAAALAARTSDAEHSDENTTLIPPDVAASGDEEHVNGTKTKKESSTQNHRRSTSATSVNIHEEDRKPHQNHSSSHKKKEAGPNPLPFTPHVPRKNISMKLMHHRVREISEYLARVESSWNETPLELRPSSPRNSLEILARLRGQLDQFSLDFGPQAGLK